MAASMARPRPFLTATAAELRRLERTARQGPEAVRANQVLRLRDAVALARGARFWAHHLADVPPIASLADLAAAAPVDKAALRAVAEVDRLTAPPPPGSRLVYTTGTTGEPFRVHYAPRGAWFQGVMSLRVLRGRGIRLLAKHCTIDVVSDRNRSSGLVRSVREARRVALAAGSDPEQLARQVLAAHPAFISGPAHLLMELGEALAGRYSPRAVLSNGETLTTDDRAALRTRFGVEPLDGYGTTECGFVAWQCHAADLYHVNHEAAVLEIVDRAGHAVATGEVGEVLLTSLWNPLAPFVRYRIGDAAAWATRACRCGSEVPALTHVVGRTFAWIIDGRGRRIAPQHLLLSLHLGERGFNDVQRYRVHQEASRRVTVEVVTTDDFTPADSARVAESYRRLLGDTPVDVRRVDKIEIARGAKFETITSAAQAPPASATRSR